MKSKKKKGKKNALDDVLTDDSGSDAGHACCVKLEYCKLRPAKLRPAKTAPPLIANIRLFSMCFNFTRLRYER
jgi:hypothetical protein